ncbi:MAG: sugar phosphate nucleotidyltransferase [Hymenobacter sp.]
MNNTYLVVMAGGIDGRFWPFSRTQHQQFHDVLGVGRSMLQLTVDRFRGICPPENVYVVTNRDYVGLVQQHLPDLAPNQILGEPIGRNTAPRIAYASYRIAQRDPQATIIVTPGRPRRAARRRVSALISAAVAAARANDVLVTLGIHPSRPDTGYGYIQYLDGLGHRCPARNCTRSRPSPRSQIWSWPACSVESGDFSLEFRPVRVAGRRDSAHAFHNYLSDIAEVFDEGANRVGHRSGRSLHQPRPTRAAATLASTYGVMEKADNVYVLPADFGWSDMGTWDSLHRVGQHDENGNMVNGDVMLYDTTGCIIKTPRERTGSECRAWKASSWPSTTTRAA